MIIESMAVAIILVVAMCLVAYLNKFQTNWIKVCHTLNFSSKEKLDVVLARIKELQDNEENFDIDKYSAVKDEFGL